jgi:hypothetical protein
MNFRRAVYSGLQQHPPALAGIQEIPEAAVLPERAFEADAARRAGRFGAAAERAAGKPQSNVELVSARVEQLVAAFHHQRISEGERRTVAAKDERVGGAEHASAAGGPHVTPAGSDNGRSKTAGE